MKKVFIATLGCKVNQCESASLHTGFEQAGMQVVDKNEQADLIVVNSCAVTAGAGAQSRQLIRQSLRKNPAASIIITGCYAELEAEKISAIEDIRERNFAIVGNSKKDVIVALGSGSDRPMQRVILGTIQQAEEICRLPVTGFSSRSRAYLKIQDGCESFCSYCIVPHTRGPSRSLPLAEIIQQAQIYAEHGHNEIVLTGIHLGYYGRDLKPGTDLATALDQLSQRLPETFFRISSLEPIEISSQLLQLLKNRRNILPHLHIPLQSGHDDILKKMNRRYTTAQFLEIINLCHSQIPDLAIGIDILAGFPGETEQQFEMTRDFLESMRFSYLHVFPYSQRPGTPAATMAGQLRKSVKDERVAALLELSHRKTHQFYREQLGQTRKILIEKKRDNLGRLKGFTDNYIDVRLKGSDLLLNSVAVVQLLSIEKGIVLGELNEHHED